MARRLVILGLIAALSQAASGCCCVRQCIAKRWHYHHPCGLCSPAFRIPGPVSSAPVGCPSCYAPPAAGPVAFGGPISYGGPVGVPISPGGPPVIISQPSQLLHGPTVEPSTIVPSIIPPKTSN